MDGTEEEANSDGEKGSVESDAAVHEAGEAAATLRERYDELRHIESRIATLERERIEDAADAYRRAHRILDQYEEDAIGTGDFGSYVQFRGEFGNAVAVNDDALAADAFDAADDAVDKKRLSESDFAAARDALDPAGEYVDLLGDYDDAVDIYRAARKETKAARKALNSRLDGLRTVAEMADTDLDVDVDRLREPIESYNEAVREAFTSFYSSASAREVFAFLDRADGTPFINVDVPPTDLTDYVTDYEAGEEPLPMLLEYADYSNSKLDHYVEDPGALRTAVAVHRTYIERLDGEPLTIDWPPADGDELGYEIDELIPLVSRVADDETVATLRSIRGLAREGDYEQLRRAAEVYDTLDKPEVALIERGIVDERVEEAERTQSIIEDVLAETKRS